MQSVVAYSQDIDPAGVMAKLDAVSDQHVKTSGKGITVPEMNQIIGMFAAMGTVPAECRLISPSLRRINPCYITPLENALFAGNMPAMMYRGENPVVLDINETLEVECDANPAGTEQLSILVWLSDGVIVPVTGEMWTINCEITLAQLAGAWAFAEISFPDSLPVGDYQIIGARAQIAGGVGFRFVPVGESHRPGGICAQDNGSHDPWAQRGGRLGVWAEFNTIQPPGMEIMSSAAVGSATYQCYIDVIKTS